MKHFYISLAYKANPTLASKNRANFVSETPCGVFKRAVEPMQGLLKDRGAKQVLHTGRTNIARVQHEKSSEVARIIR
jgi:hypothetical protein